MEAAVSILASIAILTSVHAASRSRWAVPFGAGRFVVFLPVGVLQVLHCASELEVG